MKRGCLISINLDRIYKINKIEIPDNQKDKILEILLILSILYLCDTVVNRMAAPTDDLRLMPSRRRHRSLDAAFVPDKPDRQRRQYH